MHKEDRSTRYGNYSRDSTQYAGNAEGKRSKKGQLSPKIKDNEAITILFKPGMEGNIYDMAFGMHSDVDSENGSIEFLFRK